MIDTTQRKKIYLCCNKSKKPFYKEKINKAYKNNKIVIVDQLDECDAVLCIGKKDKTMEKEISNAKLLEIPMQFIANNFFVLSLTNALTALDFGTPINLINDIDIGL